ncbi:MAG: L-aspartate oxidase [Acidobacteriota bacterium]
MTRWSVDGLVDSVRDADAVIVGSGVAGLTAALALAPRRVVVVTKTRLGAGGSSRWAQGGVAAALGVGDTPRLHADDTLAAAAGLADARSVAVLTEEGPAQVRWLIEQGARFDRDLNGALELGREGAHDRRRIVHADGDRTGAEIVRTLVAAVHAAPSIDIVEDALATDLALDGESVRGVVARLDGRSLLLRAPAVVLATGGFGRLYARTTNPAENTGDGLAMAARAGAHLADLEMVQFHPTALAAPQADPLPLVTEALRGEGCTLLDDAGHRFMPALDARAELAPRDLVARAIWRLEADGRRAVLDARDAIGDAFPERFPTVWSHCRSHGVDPRREPIPVTPAAHYTMAGVLVDVFGRSSLQGLWAAGEVTASGVHGANRLASNSLLEALVWGERVARDIAARPATRRSAALDVAREPHRAAEDATTLQAVRALAWRHLGLVRDADGLQQALGALDTLCARRDDAPGDVANLVFVARLVAAAAQVREESRGGHYRADFPHEDATWARRLVWRYRGGRRVDAPLEKVVPRLPSLEEIA